MKKNSMILLSLTAVLGMASCQVEALDTAVVGGGSSLSITADIEHTKTTLDSLQVDWEDGDMLYLVTSDGTWGAASDAEDVTVGEYAYSSGKFLSDAVIPDGNYTFHVLYGDASRKETHRSAGTSYVLQSVQNQDCANPTAHLKANDALAGKFSAVIPQDEDASVSMGHLFALMRVDVRNSTGSALTLKKFEMNAAGASLAGCFTVNYGNTPIDASLESDPSETVTVNLTSAALPADGSLPVYFVIAPLEDYTGDVTLSVTDSRGSIYSRTVSLNKMSFEAGSLNTTSFTLGGGDLIYDVMRDGILIDNCDDLNDGWVKTLDDMSVDTKDYIYGSGAITAHSTAKGTSQFFMKVYATPVDASSIPFAGAYLRLRLYVDKAANLPSTNAGQIELTSGGSADVQELNWTFDKFKLKDGWNMIYLPFANAAKTGGEFDMSRINYFRIYHGADAGGTTMKLDEIRVVNLNVLDNCDVQQNCYQTNLKYSIDKVEKKEGVASLVASGDLAANGTIVFYQFPYGSVTYQSNVSLENGYLQFSLYVDDAARFNAGSGGQIEISSSGKADNKELSWRFSEIDKLETGWNTLDLKLSKANKVGGDIDLSAINWFRIYQGSLTAGSYTLRLDNILFYEEGYRPVYE